MRHVLLILSTFLLSSCIEPILFTKCAIETPFTTSKKTRFYEAKLVYTGEVGTHQDSTIIQCNVVDYSCHAGEMGLDEVWETIPPETITLSTPHSNNSEFKIGTPNCYGLVTSNESLRAGREDFSYWSNPRIELGSETKKIKIWYPEHREKLISYGIKELQLTVVQVDGHAPNKSINVKAQQAVPDERTARPL